jgi:hypothetical protein
MRKSKRFSSKNWLKFHLLVVSVKMTHVLALAGIIIYNRRVKALPRSGVKKEACLSAFTFGWDVTYGSKL